MTLHIRCGSLDLELYRSVKSTLVLRVDYSHILVAESVF